MAIDEDGPIIDLSFLPARSGRAHRGGRDQPQAATRTIRALIDTGSDATAIHPAALAGLGLEILRLVPIRRPADAGSRDEVPLYDLLVAIEGAGKRSPWIRTTVVAVEPATPSVLAILGRDILQLCTLLYDGPVGSFTLSL